MSIRMNLLPSFLISFLDDNLSKQQWIFTKLVNVHLYYEDLVWDCLLANFEGVICPRHAHIFVFPDENLLVNEWIFTKLGMCIDIVEIWFRIAY